MFKSALKTALLVVALCCGPSLAQTAQPTISDERTGSGFFVADNTDQEMDHGITLWVLGGFGFITVMLLTWLYLRRRDRVHHGLESTETKPHLY